MTRISCLKGPEEVELTKNEPNDNNIANIDIKKGANEAENPNIFKSYSNSAIITDIDEYSDPSDIENTDYSDYSDDYDEELFAEIDNKNSNNIHEVSNLANKIFKVCLHEESSIGVSKEKITNIQKEITPKHREAVVRWMIQLNYHYKLTSDTLYNAVTYFDIVLSNSAISFKELQLYAAVCYWMSAKIDNRCQPSVANFNEISNESFTVQQFTTTEVKIFTILNFNLSYPTSKFFMRRLLYLTSNDPFIIEMTNFFTEIALQKWEFVGMSPYNVANAAVFIACATLGIEDDAFNVIRAVKNLEEFVECSKLMLEYGNKTISKQNITEKNSALFSKLNFDVVISKYIN